MKLSLLIATLLLPLTLWAKVPNEDDILRKTMDAASPYYFTSLMMRYNNLEPLNAEEYHYLYYGYAYQDSYNPTAVNSASEQLYASLMSLNTESNDAREMNHIISLCNQSLMNDPFNTTALNMLVFAYGKLGDKEKEQAYAHHHKGILDTIKSSGDGRSEKYPLHILMFSHAVDVLSSMGLESKRPEIISRTVQYIPLCETLRLPDGKVKGFYFDYSRIYRKKPAAAPTKKRTWQFNNLGVKEY
ncbi:MAG: DUF4919 domain-containing protein [Alistipes sp.]|nr:DUF4919 domain-containing protein [Alistipes sp.]